MSSFIVTFPQVVQAATPFAVAVAPAAIGFGLAYAAGAAAYKLKADYSAALSEFRERTEEAERQRLAHRARQEESASEAASLVDSLGVSGYGTASAFVQASLKDAIRLARQSGLTSIEARAQELAAREGAAEEITDEVVRLTNELYVALAGMEERAPATEELFAAVRREVETLASEEKREPLLAQLERLEALPREERAVALQGIQNVRDRAGRLIQAQIRAEQERTQRREVAAQTTAMLQALTRLADAPEATEAIRLLEQFGALFSGAQSPSLSDLEAFMGKAKALFDACQARLDMAATAAYVADSVADTLAELGYKVSQVPAEGTAACLVSVDESTGVMVNIGREGQVTTEMVAFEEAASQPDEEAQERVCKLVDDVIEGLKRRDVQVKEKLRRRLKKHGTIKVVDRPQQTAPIVGEQLKERALP